MTVREGSPESELNGVAVLVTGGTGFIGSHVVRTLLELGADVTVADRNPHPDPDVRCVTGELADPAVRRRAVRPGTRAIIHLAAVTSVLRSLEDPQDVYEVNVEVTQGLLELARAEGVGSFVLASTNAVTGDVGAARIDENIPLRPLTPYGATKAAGEMLLSAYSAAYGVTGTSLRFANVYGPGMRHKDSFVPRLMRAALDGSTIQVYGDGTQLRDYVHVHDIVRGMLLAWRAGHTGPLILGSGRSESVNDLIEAARQVTGAPIPVDHVPGKPGEMPAVVLDVSAARALGYEPAYDLTGGLKTVWSDFTDGAPG
ncbi:NAD-dependent epimerase/dehydratase family protein [Rhizohabitans arisaemae]|uniref:NAD-dependent epimerase/dehydratase family protein n=1 Tax=Rhizohabitans arisaemae TaxID=2720610 RepID=UPI0024B12B68|nr:NAD-dependent epimerase/dehydratase family protein [Rhizohabitans arisaemae]